MKFLKNILDRINNYMSDGERTHEWFNVILSGLVMAGLATTLKLGFTGFIVLCLINFGRVICQEVGIERDWDFKEGFKDPDYYYDQFMRPLGSSLLCYTLAYITPQLWLPCIVATLILTYKWSIFDRN